MGDADVENIIYKGKKAARMKSYLTTWDLGGKKLELIVYALSLEIQKSLFLFIIRRFGFQFLLNGIYCIQKMERVLTKMRIGDYPYISLLMLASLCLPCLSPLDLTVVSNLCRCTTTTLNVLAFIKDIYTMAEPIFMKK